MELILTIALISVTCELHISEIKNITVVYVQIGQLKGRRVYQEREEKVRCELHGIYVPKAFSTDGVHLFFSNLYGFQKVFSLGAGG